MQSHKSLRNGRNTSGDPNGWQAWNYLRVATTKGHEEYREDQGDGSCMANVRIFVTIEFFLMDAGVYHRWATRVCPVKRRAFGAGVNVLNKKKYIVSFRRC